MLLGGVFYEDPWETRKDKTTGTVAAGLKKASIYGGVLVSERSDKGRDLLGPIVSRRVEIILGVLYAFSVIGVQAGGIMLIISTPSRSPSIAKVLPHAHRAPLAAP